MHKKLAMNIKGMCIVDNEQERKILLEVSYKSSSINGLMEDAAKSVFMS